MSGNSAHFETQATSAAYTAPPTTALALTHSANPTCSSEEEHEWLAQQNRVPSPRRGRTGERREEAWSTPRNSRSRIDCVYSMRMTRVNITVPDDVAARAREAGLNVSRVATRALLEELDRRAMILALDTYLAQLEAELGPVGPEEALAAATWADRVLAAPAKRSSKRRRSA